MGPWYKRLGSLGKKVDCHIQLHNVMYKISSVPSAIRVKHYEKFSICLIFACEIITLRNYVNQSNVSSFS